MKFKPLEDKIIVKSVEGKDVSSGGIFLTDQSKKKSGEGTVVAVGPGRVLDSGQILPLTVKVGDVVAYQTYSASEIRIDSDLFYAMRESEVLTVLEN